MESWKSVTKLSFGHFFKSISWKSVSWNNTGIRPRIYLGLRQISIFLIIHFTNSQTIFTAVLLERMRIHKRTRKQMCRRNKTRKTHRRQKAGGEHATYCVACGKPLSNWSLDLSKTDWLNKNIGFDSEHNLVVNLDEDEFLGIFGISETQTRATNESLDNLEGEGLDIAEFGANHDDMGSITDVSGLILHRDCVKVMKLFGLDVNFELVNKLHESCTTNKKYQGQYYDWEEALSEDESNYMSPLESKEQRGKLMEGCAAIEEVRNAPRKEKERRQRIVNTRRFASTSRKMKLPINAKNIISSYLINTKKNVRRTNKIKPEEILNVYEENNNNNYNNNNNNNYNNYNNDNNNSNNKNKNKKNTVEPAGGAGRRLSVN